MTDTMLEALRAHVKEPEPIDWEAKCKQLQTVLIDCYKHEGMVSALLYDKNEENKLLEAKITCLEQRCAELEGNGG